MKTNKCKVLVAVGLLCAVASAQAVEWWFHSAGQTYGDLNTASGYSATGGEATAWNDTYLYGGSAYSNDANGDLDLMSLAEVTIAGFVGPSYVVLSFPDLLTEQMATINTAELWWNVQSFMGTMTFDIRGLHIDDANWTESDSSWNEKDRSDDVLWHGDGAVTGSLTGNYGTATHTAGEGEWASVDLTSALEAYRNGDIGAIAFVPVDSGMTYATQFYSSEYATASLRPGLFVDYVVPEPGQTAAVLLTLSGAWIAYRRMRSGSKA